jgi:hypothetical protein
MPEDHPKTGDVIIWDMESDSMWWVGTQGRDTAAQVFEGPGAWDRARTAARELAGPEVPIWKRYKDGHFEKLTKSES